MNNYKLFFYAFSFLLAVTTIAIAADPKNVPYRYLPPLSTNLKPDNSENLKFPEFQIPKPPTDRKHSSEQDRFHELLSKQTTSSIEKLRESRNKWREIEREILKRQLEEKRELRKFLAELQREQAGMERQARKHLEEMQREFRKHQKELERR